MKTTHDRVPESLSEYLKQKAKEQGTSKTDLYKQIEQALKGVPPISDCIKKKKDGKMPFEF
jgi:hypothetical protein